MENLDRRMLLAGLGLVGVAAASAASAGTLNPPPGPVASTGKTTNEIEPRIPVQSLAGDAGNSFIISQPGSYYLTGNINGAGGKNGISIQADDVTLDLNGFALIGQATGSGIGVDVPAPRTGLCIRNGTIRLWRSHGAGAFKASSSVLEGLRALNNVGDGLQISNESAVRDCVMTGNGGRGLFGDDRVLVSGCVADVNSGSGIALGSDVVIVDCLVSRSFGGGTIPGLLVRDRSNISRCTVTRNAGIGIQIRQGSTVADCSVGFNGSFGIFADVGSTVRNCNTQSNVADGIVVLNNCQVLGNTCDSNGLGTSGFGIITFANGSRIDGNICTGNFGGIKASNNLVIRNSVRGSGAGGNYVISAGSAAVVDVSAVTSFGIAQPWTNFIY